jgi:hypothetical protein
VYSNSSALRTIEVIDAQGGTYIDTTIMIAADPNNLQTVPLNFTLYPGTSYFIKCRGYVDLFRNSSGANFPYLPQGPTSSIQITGTNAGSGGYYYFFYNWDYRTFVCNTARVPVYATDTCIIGVNEIFGGSQFTIHPNPTNSELTISFGKTIQCKVQLSNTIGEVLEEIKTNSSTLTFNIADRPKGIYFITAIDEEGNKAVRKIVKM